MATAIRKITLSASRDIPFNKPSSAAVAQAVECEVPTLSLADALAAVPDGRMVLQLQDGLVLPRAKVMAEFRIKLFGFTDDMVDRLEAIGLISDILWKLRLFVPSDASGPSILAKMVERHPLVHVAHKTAG